MKFNLEENEFIEFKESLIQIDKGIKSLTSMLNKNSFGTVYFGIKDDREICGVLVGKDTLSDIRRKIKELVSPEISPKIFKTTFDNKEIVIVEAYGSDIPYSYDGRYFIRNASSDNQISPHLLRKMLENNDSDLIQNASSKVQNLTFKDFLNYSRSRGLHISSIKNYIKSKKLINKVGKFNLMSFLLSDQNDVSIKVVRFRGIDKTSMLERTEYGNRCLLNSIDNVLNAVKQLNITKVDLSNGIRKEINLFDFESFREGWINACLHNHWISMVPPTVFIYDDRIEILSYGDLPYNLDKENFFKGLSMPINKSLNDIFISLKLSEQSGHGVPIIVKNYGRKAFEFSSETIRITLPFAFRPSFVSLIDERIYLTKTQKDLLSFLENNPYKTQLEVSNELKMSIQNVKKITGKLVKEGYIARIGSKQKGYWVKLKNNLD